MLQVRHCRCTLEQGIWSALVLCISSCINGCNVNSVCMPVMYYKIMYFT
uniref:Uncharacterized protein n=1 Tax=Anguilla anguilla TaxID=7936 RepID=A0A0E9PQ88_ANGAN